MLPSGLAANMSTMSEELGLDPARHRNLEGRNYEPWVRRVALSLLALLPLLALANEFGQQPSTTRADGPAASISLSSPTTVRGGLLFQAAFHIDAKRQIEKPVLHLAEGWLQNLSLNTLEPSPVDETWKDGGLELTFAALPAGQELEVFLQYQVNPTAVGRQSQDVRLLDGETVVAEIDRTLTVIP
jgi:hypothetical protein